MQAGEICKRNVMMAKKTTSIVKIAQLMRNEHVGSVVIVDEHNSIKKPVGIVTDRDLVLEVLATEAHPQKLVAADLMSSDLAFCDYSDEIWRCMQIMQSRGIRRLPVVNHKQSLIGILSMDDIIDVFVAQLGELSRMVSNEQYREKIDRP